MTELTSQAVHRPSLELPKTWTGEARATAALAAPIAATQLLWMAIGIADVVMIGRLGAEPLAVVALATRSTTSSSGR